MPPLKTEIKEINQQSLCYHCGNDALEAPILFDEKTFCCEGCKTVYEILNQNNLCDYYDLNNNPGITAKNPDALKKFAVLDDAKVRQKLIQFTDGKQTKVTFYIPYIHCSSCVWLLEVLYKLNAGIISSQVNFLRKEVSVTFKEDVISLRQLAELLTNIGYEPKLSFDDIQSEKKKVGINKNYYKLGVAFFAFGNIMLLSFPEYLGIDELAESEYRQFFGYLNFILALPVMFYSASGFFNSAYQGLRQGVLNMDFPIVLGIIAMFVRSSYEIFSGTGAGYMDTLASLVFLMLVGRMFQNKSYERISFERDYKSYFPVSTTVIEKGEEKIIPLSELKVGQRLIIRNGELIPADAILFKGEAHIDYSFVTGESVPVEVVLGEIVYAGGRQQGGAIEVEVIKEVSQSYLTQLWNDKAFKKETKNDIGSLASKVSKWFTLVVLAISFIAAAFWIWKGDNYKALNAFTAVLIITCPCALALSTPFTLGNAMRILGRNKLYVKNAEAIEKAGKITSIVFDKTGTLTQNNQSKIDYSGEVLNSVQTSMLRSLFRNSSHPLSKKLSDYLGKGDLFTVSEFKEIVGKGIEAKVNNVLVKAGSATYLNIKSDDTTAIGSKVYIAFDGKVAGVFTINNSYRKGLEKIIENLSHNYKLHVLSGDNDKEKEYLKGVFGKTAELHFNQSPADKLNFIKKIQSQGEKVMMIGDGLNDAGALKQSDVGIAISDDINNFSPACDAVLEANEFHKLPSFLSFSRSCVFIILLSFMLSFAYNIVGTWFAVSGELSPLFAAVLMPVSSVTIILFTTISSNISAKRKKM
ncbi:MAG: heavy metal translocating P-type ATPase [Bacteroidia bacterium]